jgi:hypothetical protein
LFVPLVSDKDSGMPLTVQRSYRGGGLQQGTAVEAASASTDRVTASLLAHRSGIVLQ